MKKDGGLQKIDPAKRAQSPLIMSRKWVKHLNEFIDHHSDSFPSRIQIDSSLTTLEWNSTNDSTTTTDDHTSASHHPPVCQYNTPQIQRQLPALARVTQARVPNAYDRSALKLEVIFMHILFYFFPYHLKNFLHLEGGRYREGSQNQSRWPMGRRDWWENGNFPFQSRGVYWNWNKWRFMIHFY